jgi:restriction system protein
MIGLAVEVNQGVASDIERQNRSVRRQLHERLLRLSPSEFENLIGRLLGSIGFQDVVVTGRSGDGGIDVRGTLVVSDVIRTRMAVQAKRWRGNVQAPIVQQVRGSLGTHGQGLMITASDFSPGARDEAERANAVPVALMNGTQLVALLVEHQIGVRRVPVDLIELEPQVLDGGSAETPSEASVEPAVPSMEQAPPEADTPAGNHLARALLLHESAAVTRFENAANGHGLGAGRHGAATPG